MRSTIASRTSTDADARLGRRQDGVGRVEADDLLDLPLRLVDLRARQVDLVDDRDDLEAAVDGEVGVGERLRLDALRGVDDQQRAFAGGQRARHLVGEVDVAGRVDQVEDVGLAVLRRVVQADGVRLDGDAALALEVHVVEVLGLELARLEGAGDLEETVRQRRLAVVDVGDDREIADLLEIHCGGRRPGAEPGNCTAARVPARVRTPAARRLAPVERNPALGVGRAGVVGPRADQPVVGELLEDVRRPARDAADREDRREQRDRDAERVVGRGRVEVDVRVQLLLALDQRLDALATSRTSAARRPPRRAPSTCGAGASPADPRCGRRGGRSPGSSPSSPACRGSRSRCAPAWRRRRARAAGA